MTIYGEYLFLENFITGCLILVLTGRFCGRERTKSGVLLGGMLCGVYSFILFVPLNWLVSLIGKVGFSLIVILAAFGYGKKNVFLKTVVVFYAVSFLMGGITIGLMYFLGVRGLTGNGAVYISEFTYAQIAVGAAATYFLGSWLITFIKGKLQKEKVFTDMAVEIGDQKWDMRAFVDTGNFLRDPVSGNPAAVISASCAGRIMEDLRTKEGGQDALDSRSCAIPYRSVGHRGIMQGFRPDRIVVAGQSVDKIVLAISKEDFACWKGEETYEVLLQQQLIEGGK